MPKDLILSSPAPADRQAACEYLRAKHPRFVYESFSLDRAADALRVRFHFRIEPDIEFAPETRIEQVDWQGFDSLPAAALENLVFTEEMSHFDLMSYDADDEE